MVKFARLRLVEPAVAAGAARPGRRRAGRRPARRLGRACVAEQRDYLDAFWDAADVEVEGDPEVQQAVRFGLFHVLQAGARAEQRPIPAKGLTGPGYDGHAFWDTEMFVLPVLTYTQPGAARGRAALAALAPSTWPGSGPQTLGPARARPSRGGPSAARSAPATGRPAPPAFHINADIADAVRRYVHGHRRRRRSSARSGWSCWSRPPGCGARWATTTGTARFHIDGVTGPDEYTAVANDNVYTNLMAQRNLRAAADAATRHPDVAARARRRPTRRPPPGGTPPPPCTSRTTRSSGVHQQVGGLHPATRSGTSTHTPPEKYPLLLHSPYFDLYRKQVVKQADLVLAMHWRGDAFTPEEKARNFAYYERAHRARLVAVGLHPGGDRGRGGPPRAGPRLPAARPP